MSGFYEIDPRIEKQLNEFKQEINDYLDGKISARAFKAMRVPRGFYQEREEQSYMIRVRVAGGGITPEQAHRLAEISRRHGNAEPHVTTRQNVQLHGVTDESALERIVDDLLAVNLTAIGGGGNTVRNITSCPFSGGCKNETLPAAPAAVQLTHELVPREDSFGMPRKYKVSFSGCSRDCAYARYTDLGFVPTTEADQPGYEVYAGGGLGANSARGIKIFEHVRPEEVPYVAEGIKQLFREHGNRENKHRARLRFVKQRFGEEKFRRLCREATEKQKQREEMEFAPPDLPGDRPPANPGKPPENDWFEANVRSAEESGYYSVQLQVPLGDVPAGDLDELAGISQELADNNLYTAQTQDLILKGVPVQNLAELRSRLEKLNPDYVEPLGAVNSRTCRGASTCKLGLCHSPNLRRALESELENRQLAKPHQRLNLYVSGCPNACGHHPVAELGFHGAVRRKSGRPVPSYQVVAGGDIDHELAGNYGVVPAYKIPELAADFVEAYVDAGADSFADFFPGTGSELLEDLVEQYSPIPEFTEDRNYYYDWYAEKQFNLEQLGEGECGAGVISLIESDLRDANDELEKVESGGGDLFDALCSTARALLVTRGEDASEAEEILRLFEQHFLEPGLVDDKFRQLVSEARRSGSVDAAATEDVHELLAAVEELYEKMDSSFNFPAEQTSSEATDGEADQVSRKDLRGVECPMNYVQAKLELEQMEPGARLEILVDPGEPIENVPPSLKEDGHKILEQEKPADHFRLLVEKRIE